MPRLKKGIEDMIKKKRIVAGAAAAAVALGIVTLAPLPAFAQIQDQVVGTWCTGHSWSSANSSASTKHLHQVGILTKEVRHPAGSGTLTGWAPTLYGPVQVTIDSSGSFSSWGIGCIG